MLEVGSYGLNVTVFDTYDNVLTAIFSITIEPPEDDTTPTGISSTTTGTNTAGVDPMMTLVLGAGIGSVPFIIILIYLLRRKS
jgi:hypothetical protein